MFWTVHERFHTQRECSLFAEIDTSLLVGRLTVKPSSAEMSPSLLELEVGGRPLFSCACR